MVSVEELRKTIEWLRNTTNDNIIYIDRDMKRELGNVINDLIKLNEIYKSRIDKAIEYIKSYLPNYDFDHSNLEKLLQILGDKE